LREKDIYRTFRITAIAGIFFLIVYFSTTYFICELFQNASWCRWWPHIPVAKIEDYIKSSGVWGIAVSIGLMVIHSFVPFPAELVAIANGMLYGPIWGTVITWTGAMLGAFLAFGLARKLGYEYINHRLKEKNQQRLKQWISSNGTVAILISRLIPVISFNLINYLAGLSGISKWTFTWTTAVGILPVTIVMVVMGDNITNLSWKFWLILGLLGTFLLLIYKLPFFQGIIKERKSL